MPRASHGRTDQRPEKSSIMTGRSPAARRHDDDREAPNVASVYSEEVEQDGAAGLRAAAGERDEQEPGVRDARIGEHAFDVALGEPDGVADQHRGDGEAGHGRVPGDVGSPGTPRSQTRSSAANAAALTVAAM